MARRTVKLLLRGVAGALMLLTGILGVGLLFSGEEDVLRIESVLAASDPQFPTYAGVLLGTPVTRGDDYEVLTNGDQFFPAMLEAVTAARTRISLVAYIYSRGQVGRAFTKALIDAAARGVEVRIMLDAFGSKEAGAENVAALRAAGARVGWFRRPRWHSLTGIRYRTHRKILVVDGQIAFVGGPGFADLWLGDAQGPGHWRDTQVRISGPAASYLEAAFYENWAEAVDVLRPVLPAASSPADSAARSLVEWSSPAGNPGRIKWLYQLSLAAARRTIDIQSPYFITDASTRWVLEQAARRGVRIRILMDGDHTDAAPVKAASRAQYDTLLRLGLELYEYQPTMMHAKVMIVDGIWSVFGSSNFDNRSMELNEEVNVAVHDHRLAGRFQTDFDADLGRARRIELEWWQERSISRRLREQFWGLLGELF